MTAHWDPNTCCSINNGDVYYLEFCISILHCFSISLYLFFCICIYVCNKMYIVHTALHQRSTLGWGGRLFNYQIPGRDSGGQSGIAACWGYSAYSKEGSNTE